LGWHDPKATGATRSTANTSELETVKTLPSEKGDARQGQS